MTETIEEISKLARILHTNGDKILNGTSKLSINAALLQEITSKLGEIAIRGQGNDPFEVLSPIHALSGTIDHLQLIHDFFQKTVGLKIENSANTLRSGHKIDVSKFKKLKYLELKRVPVKQIIGLKLVQHQIECIVCERGMTALEHLLAECGADNSTGFVWSELKEAVLSFNDIKIVDSSVAFAPRLQVLDLSHNQIFDVNAIERLPNLKYVNLSYNSLTVIPMFNNSARKQMQVLILKNNYIEDLTPLFGLDCLTELDLSHNLICGFKSFRPFLSMSTLRCLSLSGNPVCSLASYRIGVVRNLHISASFGNFVLDGVHLMKRERENVGTEVIKQTPLNSGTAQILVVEPVGREPEAARPRNKTGKVRLAVIPNLDGTYEGVPPELDHVSLSAPSCEHLLTKQRIKTARETYKDNWLRSEAAEVVQDILGLPNVSLSSTPYDDSCLDAILKDVHVKTQSNIITTTAIIEPIPRHLQTDEDSFLTCDDENISAYFSLNESRQTDEKETSPDIETIQDPEEEEGQTRVYLVVRLFYEGSEIRRENVFLSLSETELREEDVTDGRTLCSWSLTSIESAILVREKEVHLAFKTIRRDRRERFYELEAHEAVEFYNACSVQSEAKSLSEMKAATYRCVACSADFFVEKVLPFEESSIACPVCGSKVVVLGDENAGRDTKSAIMKKKSTHNRSASVGVVQDVSSIAHEVSKCSSQSNIALPNEAVSNTVPTNFYASGKRCDSDIEIISNPSESSIEVIDAPNRPNEEEERLLDDKMLTPHLSAAAVFAGLTESSSSGSITDSICTAYENSSMVSSGVSKKSGLESSTLIEEPSESFDFPVKDSEKVLGKIEKARKPVDKDIDLMKYSYTDFAKLDHRLKLYVYAHLFEDNWEECLFLLRCQILSSSDASCYEACVVCSNLKIYVLKITGQENGEEASKFLQKVDNLSFSVQMLKSWEVILWDQGFSVSFQNSADKCIDFLILLKEMERTKAFLSFISKFERFFPQCGWIKTPSPTTALRITESLVLHAEDPTLLVAVGFLECRINQDVRIPDGAIFVTPTDLFVVSSLKWISNKQREAAPVPTSVQKLCDLIQANIFDQELSLQFINESEEKEHVWNITLASEAVVDHLLSQLRTPWEALFSVPLQVTQDDHF